MSKPDSGAMRIIEGPANTEPKPMWPEAPRYAKDNMLPSYRFVPGMNPHPRRDPEGHSQDAPIPETDAIGADNWRENQPYLRSMDLYHQGYLWESREAWEGLWRLADRDSPEANLLQALILNSAAQLTAHRGNAHGTRTRSQAARWRLARIRTKEGAKPGDRFLGLDIGDLIEQMKRHYGPVWDEPDAKNVCLMGSAPRLELDRS